MAKYPQSRALLDLVDCIACIRKAPRTADELAELTGLSVKTVRGCLDALESEVLIQPTGPRHKPHGRVGLSPIEYRWLERPDPAARCRICGCADPAGGGHPTHAGHSTAQAQPQDAASP